MHAAIESELEINWIYIVKLLSSPLKISRISLPFLSHNRHGNKTLANEEIEPAWFEKHADSQRHAGIEWQYTDASKETVR